jgi:quercetin dioxygenase-like cupin family protein
MNICVYDLRLWGAYTASGQDQHRCISLFVKYLNFFIFLLTIKSLRQAEILLRFLFIQKILFMKQKLYSQFILALCISIAFFACKGKDNGEKTETTTDNKMTNEPTNPADMDGVKVAPNLYKVLADTLSLRIVAVTYKPGDSSAMHWHPDYAVYSIGDSKVTFYSNDGSKMESEMKAGQTLVSPSHFHSVKNSGNTDVNVILFEVTRTGKISASDPATDAAKVAPGVYKIKNDTLGIRVIEVNANPGQVVAMHSHPENALYVLEGGMVEFTDKNGTKTQVEMKKGMAHISPAEMHSVKNTGKTTLKAILVEVFRAMN